MSSAGLSKGSDFVAIQIMQEEASDARHDLICIPFCRKVERGILHPLSRAAERDALQLLLDNRHRCRAQARIALDHALHQAAELGISGDMERLKRKRRIGWIDAAQEVMQRRAEAVD